MRGPDAIEAQLELERRFLAIRLETLSGHLTPSRLRAEAGGFALDFAGRAVTAAWRRGASRAATAVASPPVDRAPGLRRDDGPHNQQEGDSLVTDTSKSPGTLSDSAEEIGDRARASVDALRALIEDGLDGLPEAARERIRKARAAAIAAQAEVEARARAATDAARTTASDNPLLVGALAFAAGAAIASLLPRTSVENRTIGAHRDRLFDEAERIYREERDRLSAALARAGKDAGAPAEDDGGPTPRTPTNTTNGATA